jgi:hypothetical protein
VMAHPMRRVDVRKLPRQTLYLPVAEKEEQKRLLVLDAQRQHR